MVELVIIEYAAVKDARGQSVLTTPQNKTPTLTTTDLNRKCALSANEGQTGLFGLQSLSL